MQYIILKPADVKRKFSQFLGGHGADDRLVATVAIRTGSGVLCRDQHFSQMHKVFGPRLKVDQV